MTVQDKKDGLDLLAGMVDETTRKAITKTFEGMLTQYLFDLINPNLSDEQVSHVRAKAIGLVETLDQMGVKMASAAEALPVKRAARERVGQSFGQEAGY